MLMEIKMRKVMVVTCGVCLLLSGVSFALDSGIGIDVTTDFYSKYVWRGQNLTDDWVMQPGVSTSFGGFTLGIWGNVDMTDENGEEWEFTEIDYSIDYSGSLTDVVGYSVGYIYYEFPSVGGDTYEFYGGLSADVALSPSVTWYYDADEVEGSYVSFAIGHSFEEIAKLSEDTPIGMDIGLNVGWADSDYNVAYWGVDDSGFNDLTLSIGFPMEIGGWSVSPSVNYVKLIDSDIRSSASDDDIVYAGVSIGTSF
jgi:uncharacterized protein (TIGR02001 family)